MGHYINVIVIYISEDTAKIIEKHICGWRDLAAK